MDAIHPRDAMPPVPAGMVRVADCGTYDRSLNAEKILLASATAALHGYPEATLCHWTRGYRVAGSCMAWRDACWSVTYWTRDGCQHGRNFLESHEAEARAYFATLTDPAAVSAKRQEDARLEETVYAPARAKAAAERAAREAEERARKAARRKARRSA